MFTLNVLCRPVLFISISRGRMNVYVLNYAVQLISATDVQRPKVLMK